MREGRTRLTCLLQHREMPNPGSYTAFGGGGELC